MDILTYNNHSEINKTSVSTYQTIEPNFHPIEKVGAIKAFPNLSSIPSRTIKGVKILFEKVMDFAEKAQMVTSINSSLVNQGQAVQALVLQPFKAALTIERILVPFRFVNWLNAPLIGLSLVQNGIDFVQTPGLGKIVPVINTAVSFGDLADLSVSVGELLKDVGAISPASLVSWAAPVTGVAMGLQALSIIINSWGFWEASYTLNKLKERLGENGESTGPATTEQYIAALDFLTKEPKSRMQKFRAKFFKVLSDWQEKKIKKIAKKISSGRLDQNAAAKTLNAIKHRFTLKQVCYAVAIAAAMTGIVGVLVLTFAPTPAAPIGWVLVGAGATAVLIGTGVSIYSSRRFNRELLAVLPKRKETRTPLYKRPWIWMKKLIRRGKNESYEFVRSGG